MKKLLVWLSWTGGFVSMHRKRIFQVTETHETVVYTKNGQLHPQIILAHFSPESTFQTLLWKGVFIQWSQGLKVLRLALIPHIIFATLKKMFRVQRERELFQNPKPLKHYKCDLKINFKIAGIFTFFNPNKFLFTLTQALFAIFWRLDENMWATTVMSEMFMTVMQFNFTGKPSIPH